MIWAFGGSYTVDDLRDVLDGGGAAGVVLGDGVSVDAGGGAGDDGEGEQGGDAGRSGLAGTEADVVDGEALARGSATRWRTAARRLPSGQVP